MADADVLGTETPTSRRERYWPELDGLRAVAVVLVIAFHAGVLPAGYRGVDVFFTLSGFLITTVLLEEWAERSTFSLGRFYARRALRLLPAFIVALAGAVVVALAIGGVQAHTTLRTLPYALTYTTNYAHTHDLAVAIPGVFWSLAVEEQFYLVWPVVLLVALRGGVRWALGVTVALSVAMVIARPLIVGADGGGYAYFATEVRAVQLLIGAGAALLIWLWAPSERFTGVGAFAGLAVLVGVFAFDQWSVPRWPDLVLPLVGVATAAVVVHLTRRPARVFTIGLANRGSVAVGRVSYGMYLWHVTVATVIVELWSGVPAGVLFVVALAVTFVVAWLSYRVIELPFLRLKRRLR